jgi:hypothetical protein
MSNRQYDAAGMDRFQSVTRMSQASLFIGLAVMRRTCQTAIPFLPTFTVPIQTEIAFDQSTHVQRHGSARKEHIYNMPLSSFQLRICSLAKHARRNKKKPQTSPMRCYRSKDSWAQSIDSALHSGRGRLSASKSQCTDK